MKFLRCYRILGLAVAVAMIITVAACSKKEQEKSGAVEEMGATTEAAQSFVNEQRKEDVGALQAEFDEFNKKFDEFSQRNAYVFTEEKRNLVSDIEEAQTRIEKQLVEARSAADEAWEQIKKDVTATMEKLEQAMIDFES